MKKDIIGILEEAGIRRDLIDSVSDALEEREISSTTQSTAPSVMDYSVISLENQRDNETDWKKKAALSAKIISLGL